MTFEIERKFLVRGNGWQPLVTKRISIRQAYLNSNGKASIRVRINDDGTATLSIKSKPTELRRLELEYPIPVLEAEALMALRHGSAIENIRHEVPWDGLKWEIDVFSGENAGLVIAEIELRDEKQHFELPDWIGAEVTGRREYYNSYLVQAPFRTWAQAPAASA
jgi:adenylate cyclase